MLGATAPHVDGIARDVADLEVDQVGARIRCLVEARDESDRPVVDDDDVVQGARGQPRDRRTAADWLVDDRITGEEVVRAVERDRLAARVDVAALEDRAERQVVVAGDDHVVDPVDLRAGAVGRIDVGDLQPVDDRVAQRIVLDLVARREVVSDDVKRVVGGADALDVVGRPAGALRGDLCGDRDVPACRVDPGARVDIAGDVRVDGDVRLRRR